MNVHRRDTLIESIVFLGFFIFVLLICSGCNSILPTPEPVYVTIPANTNYSPIIAWEIAKTVNDPLVPTPIPLPTPVNIKVGDDCPSPCENGWTFGDGASKQKCWKCKGDGIVHEGDPILIHGEEPPVDETKFSLIVPVEIDPEPIIKKMPVLPKLNKLIPQKSNTQVVAKPEFYTLYSIVVDGIPYYMRDGDKEFVNRTVGRKIPYINVAPISTVSAISINRGSIIMTYPVKRQQYKVERNYDQSRTPAKP